MLCAFPQDRVPWRPITNVPYCILESADCPFLHRPFTLICGIATGDTDRRREEDSARCLNLHYADVRMSYEWRYQNHSLSSNPKSPSPRQWAAFCVHIKFRTTRNGLSVNLR